jgi:hypothetical protein
MFIAVQHTITDPESFWSAAGAASLPAGLTLHHTFPAPDGGRAVCIWEAATVEAVRNFLEPAVGRVSRNDYFQIENREGMGTPSKLARTAHANA